MVDVACCVVFALKRQADHSAEFLGQGISNHADDANGSEGDEWEGDAVVSADDIEAFGFVLDDVVDLCEIAACFLDAYDVFAVVGKTEGGFGCHIDAYTTWYVIEDDRHVGCLGDGAEVLVESLLGWFVVIGADAQHTVDALEVTLLELTHHFGCVVSATSHKDGHFSVHFLDDEVLDASLLVGCEARCLAGGGKNTEKIDSPQELVVEQPSECCVINFACWREGCDEGDTQPFELMIDHVGLIIVFVSEFGCKGSLFLRKIKIDAPENDFIRHILRLYALIFIILKRKIFLLISFLVTLHIDWRLGHLLNGNLSVRLTIAPYTLLYIGSCERFT